MDDTEVQKFKFVPEQDGTLPLRSAVFQALGAASVCWSSMENKGVFQSEFAAAIGEALLEKIQEDKYPATVAGFVDIGPQCFTDGEVINYKGANFYKACDAWVTNKANGGQTLCTKRVGHPGYLHEDYDGNVRGDHN